MSHSRYAFGADAAAENERLGSLENALDRWTQAGLAEAGVSTGWRCWEVGAGRGSIARWLAEVVGTSGHVLATDLSDDWFDPGGEKIEFLRHDVMRDPAPGDSFDLVHARFLLEHLPDPRAVLRGLHDALRPGGVLLIEDSAGLELELIPARAVLERFAAAWARAGAAAGWNADYGRELMSDLRIAGFVELRGHQHRQIAPGGEAWTHVSRGIQRLRAELLDEGATELELAEVLDCLADPGNLVIGPPTTMARGRRVSSPGVA